MHLSEYVALRGFRVLVVDLDPQASLTAFFGVQPELDGNPTFYDAQGQENSARENLALIERALFAQRLVDQGYERSTVQAALAVDAKPIKEKWLAEDRTVAADLTDTGRSYSLAFKAKGGVQFGRFVAESLEWLYGEYKQRNDEGKG